MYGSASIMTCRYLVRLGELSSVTSQMMCRCFLLQSVDWRKVVREAEGMVMDRASFLNKIRKSWEVPLLTRWDFPVCILIV